MPPKKAGANIENMDVDAGRVTPVLELSGLVKALLSPGKLNKLAQKSPERILESPKTPDSNIASEDELGSPKEERFKVMHRTGAAAPISDGLDSSSDELDSSDDEQNFCNQTEARSNALRPKPRVLRFEQPGAGVAKQEHQDYEANIVEVRRVLQEVHGGQVAANKDQVAGYKARKRGHDGKQGGSPHKKIKTEAGGITPHIEPDMRIGGKGRDKRRCEELDLDEGKMDFTDDDSPPDAMDQVSLGRVGPQRKKPKYK